MLRVKPGEESLMCMRLVSTVKLTIRCHPKVSKVMGSPSCMGTFVDRRGVTSCERSLVGVSDLIQDPASLPMTAVKGASWIPGKSCKFYTRDIRIPLILTVMRSLTGA